MSENEDYVFGSRTFSILSIKYSNISNSRRSSINDGLFLKRKAWLQSNYGLSSKSSEILLSRSATQIKRVEETIHGVIDSLLLFDTRMFIEQEGKRILRHTVKLILTIGTYNIGLVVKKWKELSTFLYNRVSGMTPILAEPKGDNPFKILLTWPKIQRIVNQDIDKRLLESLAHLLSSRQFPTSDKRAEMKALETFKTSIEEEYVYDVKLLNTVFDLSKALARKCLALSERGTITKPHISMSSAGSYYETVKDGGRGKEIREALKKHLDIRPEADEVVDTPFGQMLCPAGEERWRYWARGQPYTHYPSTPFGSPITEEEFNKLNLYYQGFDEAIGCQILVVAYLDYVEWKQTGLPIPCKVLTVPEPGFKARIVTTGPYWLNILQQGLAHVLKDICSGHPSVRSSLRKSDQAWQSLYLFDQSGYPEDYAALSSDLKEATDHIPKIVALQLLNGFIQGSGLRSNLVKICTDLLMMDRSFIGQNFVSERQTRGVMMGEPLTKVILTMMNLVVEEYAYREFNNIDFGTVFPKGGFRRTFHIGGDDHLAIGPRGYLDLITEFHLRCGNHISEGKHGISNKVVRYCEKLLDIRNIYKPWSLKELNESTLGYEKSPFIDSIKVRLLSPTTKTFNIINDRNVAIGKGGSLGKILKWLNRDHFPMKWVKMVRNRFFERMGSLLPDRSSGVYWQLMLPSYWGGLDLYLPDEISDLAGKLPDLTKSIMVNYLEQPEAAYEQVVLLRKFLTNYSYRGYRLNETEASAMRLHIETAVKGNLPAQPWWSLKREYDPTGVLPASELSDIVYRDGWMTEEEILDQLLRPILFKEILLGIEKPSPYNTIRLKKRYAQLWDMLYCGSTTITADQLRLALKARPQGMFYKVGYPEECHFVSDRGYIYKSILDDALHGMPVLSIGYPYS